MNCSSFFASSAAPAIALIASHSSIQSVYTSMGSVKSNLTSGNRRAGGGGGSDNGGECYPAAIVILTQQQTAVRVDACSTSTLSFGIVSWTAFQKRKEAFAVGMASSSALRTECSNMMQHLRALYFCKNRSRGCVILCDLPPRKQYLLGEDRLPSLLYGLRNPCSRCNTS